MSLVTENTTTSKAVERIQAELLQPSLIKSSDAVDHTFSVGTISGILVMVCIGYAVFVATTTGFLKRRIDGRTQKVEEGLVKNERRECETECTIEIPEEENGKATEGAARGEQNNAAAVGEGDEGQSVAPGGEK